MIKYQKFIYCLILGVIFLGAIVPFGAQFWLPFFKQDAFTNGAEVWNQYVSIILGIIATILSIVSLKMCFSSEEASNKAEKRTEVLWNEIKGKLENISLKQDVLRDTVRQNNLNSQTKTIEADNPNWKPADKNTQTNMIVDEEI